MSSTAITVIAGKECSQWEPTHTKERLSRTGLKTDAERMQEAEERRAALRASTVERVAAHHQKVQAAHPRAASPSRIGAVQRLQRAEARRAALRLQEMGRVATHQKRVLYAVSRKAAKGGEGIAVALRQKQAEHRRNALRQRMVARLSAHHSKVLAASPRSAPSADVLSARQQKATERRAHLMDMKLQKISAHHQKVQQLLSEKQQQQQHVEAVPVTALNA